MIMLQVADQAILVVGIHMADNTGLRSCILGGRRIPHGGNCQGKAVRRRELSKPHEQQVKASNSAQFGQVLPSNTVDVTTFGGVILKLA